MKWVPEMVERLRELAPLGGREMAARLGVPYRAARCKAISLHIPLGPTRRSPEEHLRARWAEMLPAMKAALRRDMERT